SGARAWYSAAMDGGSSDYDFDTIAARSGMRVRVGDTFSTAPPIDASTTFTGESIDDVHQALAAGTGGFAYSRNANPTVAGFEQAVADLEGAEEAVAFGSGMGAIHAALLATGVETGDVILAADALYGVTRSLLGQLASFGIETRLLSVFDLEAVETALQRPDVRVLYFESIANPLLQVADVGALAQLARRHRVTCIIDNTFATPYMLRPARLGVDLVVHSATKYISGHGDVTAGLVAGSRSWCQRVREKRTVNGAVLSPFDAWLALRGLRTLPLRVQRQCSSALEVASWLHEQSWVERVYFPGLQASEYHALASTQFSGLYGGMVAFDLRASREKALAFVDGLELIIPGTSLGDVASLILYPALSSHRGLTSEERKESGIGDGLLRLSIGLESPKDLCGDLARAANAAGMAGTERTRAVPEVASR
ncbi:MAG: trans-sulfuration enzyme family protein, partial [Chloroflexota bacterium]